MSRKIVSLLLLAALLVCAAAASLAQVRAVDWAGREIALDAPAARIVALTPADCEILYALGAQDALAGRGEYCNYPPEILDVPVVLSGAGANLEQILALAPQVVLLGSGFDTAQQAQALQRLGVTAVMTGADTIAQVYDSIRLIGALTDREGEAEALIGDMQDTLASAAQQSGARGKTVYFEISPLQYGLYTAGAGTFMDELTGLLGAQNIFADVQGWTPVSEEQVLLRNPDVILTTTMHWGEGPAPDEEIMARAGWEGLAAVQSGRVYQVDADLFSRPGPRLADAALELYRLLSGE